MLFALEVMKWQTLYIFSVRIRRVWLWLLSKLNELSEELHQCSNWTILNLAFNAKDSENEVVWLLCQFVYYTWNHFASKETELQLEKFFGFLSWKYKSRNGSIGNISGFG